MKNAYVVTAGSNDVFIDTLKEIFRLFEISCEIHCNKASMDRPEHFEYIIVNGEQEEGYSIENGGFCFINMDNYRGKGLNIYGNIVTYGLGSKNTVTVSSGGVEEYRFVYCLQRFINKNALGTLEPREIIVERKFQSENELYAALVGITIALLEGKCTLRIQEKLAK